MSLILGLDAGGTFTDAVLIDAQSGSIRSCAKAPTRSRDLAAGIAEALDALPGQEIHQVTLACLSTTLATNAVIEGQGGAVGLILIGYDHPLLEEHRLLERMPAADAAVLVGGHDGKGDEKCPLDTAALQQAVRRIAPHVEAFAVSGYFSIMNPEHELKAKQVIEAEVGLPVVCGHELTQKLNAVKRVITVVLNARLLPLIRRLMDAVKEILIQRGINARLMVVRGDGSLMDEQTARLRPVEAVLSGPAASAIGAYHLSRLADAVVVDIGGTSTDIAVLQNGRPWTNPTGAVVGGWRTSVEAVDVRSIGLGGNSLIRLEHGSIRLLPQRAIPFCQLAVDFPGVLQHLQVITYGQVLEKGMPEYLVLENKNVAAAMPQAVKDLAAQLSLGPIRLEQKHLPEGLPGLLETSAGRIAGLTPSDLFWNPGIGGSCEAAETAARLAALTLGLSTEDLCRRVQEKIVRNIEMSFSARLAAEPPASMALPIVGIGAPAGQFVPSLAARRQVDCVIPKAAAVGNAVGAAVSCVSRTVEVRVQPYVQGGGTPAYLVHAPGGRRKFNTFNEALDFAEHQAVNHARSAVLLACSQPVTVVVDRHEIPLGESKEVTVRAFASGRSFVQGDYGRDMDPCTNEMLLHQY